MPAWQYERVPGEQRTPVEKRNGLRRFVHHECRVIAGNDVAERAVVRAFVGGDGRYSGDVYGR